MNKLPNASTTTPVGKFNLHWRQAPPSPLKPATPVPAKVKITPDYFPNSVIRIICNIHCPMRQQPLHLGCIICTSYRHHRPLLKAPRTCSRNNWNISYWIYFQNLLTKAICNIQQPVESIATHLWITLIAQKCICFEPLSAKRMQRKGQMSLFF